MNIARRAAPLVATFWIAAGCAQDAQDGSNIGPAATTSTDVDDRPSPAQGGPGATDEDPELAAWKWSFAELDFGGAGTAGLGESCASSSDCRADLGLACVGQQCVASSDPTEPMSGGVDAPPRRRGGAGESCESRRDCEAGLVCILDVCALGDDVSMSESDGGTVPARLGVVGESCLAHDDCSDGLACMNQRCLPADSGLEPSGKDCAVIECREPIDCCPTDISNCAALQTACEAAEPTSLLCRRFEATCLCDGSNYGCEQGRCESLFSCSELVLCPGLMVCDEGTCVRCVSDTDCPGGAKCSNHQCAQACEKDGECARFHQCLEGACVDVGCQTDRECKVFLQNQQALCQDGTCFAVCSSDLNCGAAEGSNLVCHQGTCVDAGCETDEECRLREAGVFGGMTPQNVPAITVECREPAE